LSQALPGFFMTAPPSVCVPAVIGALTLWIQNHTKKGFKKESNTQNKQTNKQTYTLLYCFFVCLSTYMYGSKCTAGVPSCQELHGQLITAHHVCAFSTFGRVRNMAVLQINKQTSNLAVWWLDKQTNNPKQFAVSSGSPSRPS